MTVQEQIDRRIIAGAPLVFPPKLCLALDALLQWAKECEPDAWPSVASVLRFARFYGVNPQELAAMVGIISYRLSPRGKIGWCDAHRFPELVRRTNPTWLSRSVLRAYGFHVAVAATVERARSRLH